MVSHALDRWRVVARMGDLRDRPDAELLGLFARERDEAAFELLVRRHGPMVMGVCSRLLPGRADAEDAFQATFLLLVRRAGALRAPGGVAGWLYGVARRTARDARRLAARRRRHELARGQSHTGGTPVPHEQYELAAVIDEEVARLPAEYRATVVLCDLGGKTRAEAAAELGCPEGTVASRLARGRARLAARLARRGVGPAVAVAVAVPPALARSTARVAVLLAAGDRLPASLHLLTRGGSLPMTPIVFAPVLAAVALAVGGVAWTRTAADPPAPPAVAKPAEETPAEQWAKLKAEYDAELRANTRPAIDKKTKLVVPNAFEVTQPGVQKYADRLLALGQSEDEETAVAALTLAVCGWTQLPLSDDAFDLLVERFADSPRLMEFAVEHHRHSYGKKAGRLERLLGVSDAPAVRGLCLLGLAFETEPNGRADRWAGEGDRRRGRAAELLKRVLVEGPEFVEYRNDAGGTNRIPLHQMAADRLGRLAPKPAAKPGG